ncbi:MAG: GNAT family N-acetyltransferase [Rhodobacteraceae bacterium]|nr:GNAT family N-acetyltransferase [Paracoccaceae bacterium]
MTPGPAAVLADQIAGFVPVLTTENLTLRAPRLADFPLYAEIASSDRSKGIGGPMKRREAWADWIQFSSGWFLHGHGGWSVVETATDRVLGIVCVTLEPGDKEPELGFIFAPEGEGRSLAFEAAVAARDWAFSDLGFETLVSYASPDNARSERLLERLGGSRDATEEAKFNGQVLVYRHPVPANLLRQNSDVMPTSFRYAEDR